jgi:hypothetical protein
MVEGISRWKIGNRDYRGHRHSIHCTLQVIQNRGRYQAVRYWACDETISDRGVNANFALPNAETSAIGRALANAGFSAKGKRPSREEMAAVNSKSETFTVENKLEDPVQWTTTDWVAAVPEQPKPPADCCSQGMTLRTGISKTTKKPFYGYVCLGNIKEHAKWAAKLAQALGTQTNSTGAWYFKDKE